MFLIHADFKSVIINRDEAATYGVLRIGRSLRSQVSIPGFVELYEVRRATYTRLKAASRAAWASASWQAQIYKTSEKREDKKKR
jgi:hypothetical protein